ncbi:MAG: sigma-70 family RNA polymerase sigma factor [Rhizobiales bacterium]|nr:sigma-70 family RNA polymerase sigma factor [Hyphomicrobiales bacterium]
MKTDDNQLAAQAAMGNAEAFRHLLERHYDTVYRIAYRFSASREDAEDLAQDVCTSLAQKIRSFRGDARFTTWLYRVVMNAARDRGRKQATASRLTQAYGEAAILERDEQAATKQDTDWLYETLEEVGADLKETAILVLAEGFSHGEAAQILQIKESTVSWRMHELRKILKQLVST